MLILFLYRQLNPSTVGQTVPADTLAAQAACITCAPDVGFMNAIAVMIESQNAVNKGAALNPFNASTLRNEAKCLTCLSFETLRSIEIMLRFALANTCTLPLSA